jgi:hypothetical protein
MATQHWAPLTIVFFSVYVPYTQELLRTVGVANGHQQFHCQLYLLLILNMLTEIAFFFFYKSHTEQIVMYQHWQR